MMDSFYFIDKTWEELKEYIEKKALILFPIGTVEEHGPHLPVSTDYTIAVEVAKRVAEKIKDEIPVLVMPGYWAGYSQKVMTRWPGTIRVRTKVVMDVIYDVCASLIEMGFKRIILIDAHGHHSGILNVVVREIADTYNVYIPITSPASLSREIFEKIRRSKPGGAIHAGEWETSLMLYLEQPVKMDRTNSIDIFKYESEFIPKDNFSGKKKVFWSTWGLMESKTGTYGDPTVAEKETGKKIMEEIINEFIKFIKEYLEKTK
ncbi:MAG: creatininase family protein [Candidatus Aenigmarchaeota archaeon]|nr:creatininase family protein [Candidatus Aenigmarchaeota archaeon]